MRKLLLAASAALLTAAVNANAATTFDMYLDPGLTSDPYGGAFVAKVAPAADHSATAFTGTIECSGDETDASAYTWCGPYTLSRLSDATLVQIHGDPGDYPGFNVNTRTLDTAAKVAWLLDQWPVVEAGSDLGGQGNALAGAIHNLWAGAAYDSGGDLTRQGYYNAYLADVAAINAGNYYSQHAYWLNGAGSVQMMFGDLAPAPVPEPTTLVAGLGALALALMGLRSRR